MRFALSEAEKSVNKEGMKLVKDKSRENRGVQYLRPGQYKKLQGTAGIGAYVLGPPRREDLLSDENPAENEWFPSAGGQGLSFTAAVNPDIETLSPFRREFRVELKDAFGHGFLKEMYGADGDGIDDTEGAIVPNNAAWRRIDHDWLSSTENLALKLNKGINNTSLVLAFELPKSKKILLFVGDAQRGNWISWHGQTWRANQTSVTAKDLLSRTVFIQSGTSRKSQCDIKRDAKHEYANLSWMAQSEKIEEFTAMITAVNEWTITKNDPPWRHPWPSIKEALLEKTQGRVFQTDSDLVKPDNVPDTLWNSFMSCVESNGMYFDYKNFRFLLKFDR